MSSGDGKRSVADSMLVTNRFTQTELGKSGGGYPGTTNKETGVGGGGFEPRLGEEGGGGGGSGQHLYSNSLQQQPQQQQQQKKDSHSATPAVPPPPPPAAAASLADFPAFCYNVNMLQTAGGGGKGSGQSALGGLTSGVQTSTQLLDDKSYRLDLNQPFSYNYALVNQMSLAAAAVSSGVPAKCDICGMCFANISLLSHHKRIHSISCSTNTTTTTNNPLPPLEQVYSCDLCGSSFKHSAELKSHRQNVHGSMKIKCCSSCGCEIDDPEARKKKGPVQCENCLSNSDRESILEESDGRYSKGVHPVKRRGLATITKCGKCNGSGIIFIGGNQDSLEKPYHCTVCDGSFSRYSSLWSHKRLHSGDKPFKCDYCGLTFARAAYLKNHSRVHSGERPYKCDICGMRFSQAPHLKNHERIHSGERPYECEVCSKTFARHSTLWNHRRIHTGEKPYRCNVCGSAFNQATHLKNHAKVHTGEKPYRCDVCDIGFSDRFALKRHRGIHDKYGQTPRGDLPSNDYEHSKLSDRNTGGARLEELYKCDLTGGIAFPGCSRPQEAK